MPKIFYKKNIIHFFLSSVVLITASCSLISTSYSSGYSSWDEDNQASASQTISQSISQPIDPAKKLQQAMECIEEVQRIYSFDPQILSDDDHLFQLDFNQTPTNRLFISRVLPFYSGEKRTRDHAFDRDIKIPLLRSLKEIAEAYHSFPQSFKCLSISQLEGSQLFIDTALRDIFCSDQQGINALCTVLDSLKNTGKLSEDDKHKLILFRKLAGFFYDQQALHELKQKYEQFLFSSLDLIQPASRIKVLRFLQIVGEYLKSMLPSTLNFDPNFPDSELLRNLRDKLAHLSRTNIDKILSTSDEDIKYFQELFSDTKHLNSIFDYIQFHFQQYFSLSSHPAPQVWQEYKALQQVLTSVSTTHPWKGFTEFLVFLSHRNTHSLSSSNSNSSAASSNTAISYNAEIEVICPQLRDSESLQEYADRKLKIRQILNKKGNDLSSSAELKEYLSNIGIEVDDTKAEQILRQIKDAQEEKSRVFANNKGKAKEDKKEDENKAKENFELCINDLCLQILDKTSQNDTETTVLIQKMRDIQLQQTQIRSLLESFNQPCHGYGNLTKKYQEFCKIFKEKGVNLPDDIFNWNADPSSPVEILFHKVHQTGIQSVQDKRRLQIKHIQEILNLLKALETYINYQSTFKFESDKQCMQVITQEKATEMRNVIGMLPSKPQGLKCIQEGVYEQSERVLLQRNAEELSALKQQIQDNITKFIELLNQLRQSSNLQLPFPLNEIKRDLLNQTRGQKYSQIYYYQHEQQMRQNYRFNYPGYIEKILEEQFKEGKKDTLTAEFLISAFYENLRTITDYPGLQLLEESRQIRHYFFHRDPFNFEPFIYKSKTNFEGNIKQADNISGLLAKEYTILIINVKHLLEAAEAQLN